MLIRILTQKTRKVFFEESTTTMEDLNYPDWLHSLISWGKKYTPEECMELATSLALHNVTHNGGPFGTVVADEHGVIHAVGINRVVAACDSTAHGEIIAIRRAQQKFQVFSLSEQTIPHLSLYSSSEPCIMCFGAIWWAGLNRVYWSANKEEAQAAGFSEGPVSDELWEKLFREKGTEYFRDFCRTENTLKPFEAFKITGTRY
jgi:tRNA(Arg) A34 adenosine deaminase TadA